MKKFPGRVLKGRVVSLHAGKNADLSKQPLTDKMWLRPASGRRGVVGVIDFPGEIRAGDEVEVRVYEEPDIRLL